MSKMIGLDYKTQKTPEVSNGRERTVSGYYVSRMLNEAVLGVSDQPIPASDIMLI